MSKGIIAMSFLVVVIAIAGIFFLINGDVEAYSFDANSPITYTGIGSIDSSEGLHAEVLGSIYESGEEITLYGACFGPSGDLLPMSNMTLTSWYSSGVMWHNETPFLPMGGGRFRIQMNMSSTMGTYLTQATCHWQNQEAIAFGEWQNPDWVARIADTQTYLIAVNSSIYMVSSKIDNLTSIVINRSDAIDLAIASVQNDTTNILTLLGNLNVTFSGDLNASGLATQRFVNEVYNLVHSLAPNYWVLDETANYFDINSTETFTGVSIAHPDIVHAVSNDGTWAVYDGTSWSEVNMTGYNWSDVFALQAELPYAWAVGSNGSSAVYSVNQNPPNIINGSSATAFTDIILYYDNGSVHGYIGADNGEVWYFDGSTFSLDNTLSGFGPVTISHLSDDLIFFARGDYLYKKDVGVYSSVQAINQNFVDIGVAYPDLAYAVSKDTVTGDVKVYEYDGSSWSVTLVDGGGYTPTALSVLNSQDIWISTSTATIMFHYDGDVWDLIHSPYATMFEGISVGFGNITFVGTGLYDISMLNEKEGYAVGDKGIIVKYQSLMQKSYQIIERIDTNVEILVNRSGQIRAWVQS